VRVRYGLLTLIDANLCIDDSRVFSTGFSFGAMMSYALSITRQTKLRAVVAMAAANYNLPNEPTDTNAAPVAYMGTTGTTSSRSTFALLRPLRLRLFPVVGVAWARHAAT
jgi:poly(3-hydroxybutyrate) depolymerase